MRGFSCKPNVLAQFICAHCILFISTLSRSLDIVDIFARVEDDDGVLVDDFLEPVGEFDEPVELHRTRRDYQQRPVRLVMRGHAQG